MADVVCPFCRSFCLPIPRYLSDRVSARSPAPHMHGGRRRETLRVQRIPGCEGIWKQQRTGETRVGPQILTFGILSQVGHGCVRTVVGQLLPLDCKCGDLSEATAARASMRPDREQHADCFSNERTNQSCVDTTLYPCLDLLVAAALTTNLPRS